MENKIPEILLTEEQRHELTQISPNMSDWEIAKFYTLTDYDIDIINQNRRDYNKLGFALHLCYYRYPGWTLLDVNSIPPTVLMYIAKQLGVDVNCIGLYGDREATRLNHLQKIRNVYGYQQFTDKDKELEKHLKPYALENDNTIRLMRLAIDYLRAHKIILPG